VAPTLSVFELFLQSDTIVKLVMLMLLVASFWSWAVIFDKTLRLRRLKQAAESFEETFWSGGSLDDLYDRVGQRPVDPMSAVFAAAMREWRRSAAKGLLGTQVMRLSLQQRIERVMNVTVGREMDRVERFMSFLATVGSTAPFVGLFGTVWGIMDSFQSIAASKNTSLAVVAPGIANRCSPRRSASSRRSRRSSHTTSCRPISAAMPAVSKPSPPNSAPSCRASSTRGRERWRHRCIAGTAGAAGGRPADAIARCRRST
jgi:biopolymer transport protein TolQ